MHNRQVRTSELIVLGYLGYLLLLAWRRPLSARRRLWVTTGSLLDAVSLLWLSTARADWLLLARDWSPGVHLLVCYWLSGTFFIAPMPRLEAALAKADDIVFVRWGLGGLARHGPRWLLEYLELSYLCVYLVVPVGFGLLYWRAAEIGRAVDEYWTVVLLAGLTCYGLLPWLQTLPPGVRGLHTGIERRPLLVRRLNVRILRGASVHANTLPSGHAATAFASAFAAGTFIPGALLPLGFAAVSISAAAVVGRYHYAVDSALGLLVAMAAWSAVRILGL